METNRGMVLISGVGLGAGLMYLLDPARGRRRRALARDRAVATLHDMDDARDTTGRDVMNRMGGLVQTTRSRFDHDAAGDEVIVERVRARLGRVVSHPHAITVTAQEGHVTLRGSILAHEVDRLLRQVSHVRGVAGVENRLDVYKHADDAPNLQGGVSRQGDRFALRQTHWSPTARFLTGMAGGALAAGGAWRRDAMGAVMGTAGVGLLARALTDMELKRLTGMGAGRRAIDVQKTITINAPVEQVYAFWSSYENFPRFMAHVRQVRKIGEDQSHWIVVGPAGTPVAFDTEISRRRPNELLAWKTLPGSPIQHSGVVRFQPAENGGTCLDVKMSYNPIAGGLGHSIAALLGVDPKRALDEDLVRLKSLFEEGKARAHGETVRRADIAVEATRLEPEMAATGH